MSLNPMDHDAATITLQQFTPTGDEGVDMTALRELIGRLGSLKTEPDVREALIGIFERHPQADLGSPGPVVHALEEAPLDEHVQLLIASLARKPTGMTVWMSERCFRSPTLSEPNRTALVKALLDARGAVSDPDTASMLEEALAEYGGGTR